MLLVDCGCRNLTALGK